MISIYFFECVLTKDFLLITKQHYLKNIYNIDTQIYSDDNNFEVSPKSKRSETVEISDSAMITIRQREKDCIGEI